MKLLLDESLPRRLKNELPDHEVTTVPTRGWAGKKNGDLLQLASSEFDAFITADQNIQYQQNIANLDIGVIVLAGKSNRLEDLQPLIPQLRKALDGLQPGTLVRITA